LTDIGAKLAVANTALDNVDTILSNDTLKDFLSAKNKAYLSDTKTAYAEAELLSVSANASLFQALQDRSEVKVKTAVSDALAYLNRTVDALKSCYSALEASTIAQAALDAYKSTVSGQLSLANSAVSVVQADKQASDGAYLAYSTNVSAAENSLRGADVALENAITNAKNVLSSARLSGEARVASAESGVKTSQEAYEVAKSQLAKLKSSARSEDVALANAQVSQAQSSLELINKQIEDSVLRAPLDGRVVRDEFERGEQISPGRTVFSLLDQSDYEVEVDISESDIAKINKGAEAEMTLDAFGDGRKFKAVVDFVEPAETVIQDVVYYKVTLIFSDKAESLSDIRPGMTANVTIFTAKSEQALIVPERAIIDKTDKGKVIRILRDGKVFESPVKTGLRGDGGMIEAISGVSAGDEVVVFVKAKK